MTRWAKSITIGVGVVAVVAAITAVALVTAAFVNAKNQAKPLTYVALGDSVAAGDGIEPVANRSSDDAACARSASGYPPLLASRLHARLTNLACSGATVSNGVLGTQAVSNGNVTMPAQLDRAFQEGVPDVMTITIGANDAHWVDFVGRCYASTCGTTQDSALAAQYIGYFKGQLSDLLRQIKDRSGNHAPPKVYVTGYYYPVSALSCLGGTITQPELDWINTQTDALNAAIRQAVASAGTTTSWFSGTEHFATFVPVTFSGHGLCASQPWVQGPKHAAPLHPTAAGAANYADLLYGQIKAGIK